MSEEDLTITVHQGDMATACAALDVLARRFGFTEYEAASQRLKAAVEDAIEQEAIRNTLAEHAYPCCGKVGRISRHETWCPTGRTET